MTFATIQNFSEKIDAGFKPIILTSHMRNLLFNFFHTSVFLAHQTEAFVTVNESQLTREIVIKAIDKFNNFKDSIEDFITIN
jgi:hypothetical protein